MASVPTTLLPALYGLNAMLRKFWPEHAARNEIPLAFWLITDDSLLFDSLQYLPSNVYVHGGPSGQGHREEEVENLPEGFRILVTIFHLEDEFANEGWSGLGNLGHDGVARVTAAYETVGLKDRAKALQRAYAAFQTDPDNERALKKAAGGALLDLVDDDMAFQVIAKFVRTDQESRFGTLPSDA
jgi:hypothetical protein